MDLLFPGGVARVNNEHVWTELARYCQETHGGSVSLWQSGEGRYQALLSPEHGTEFRGSSRLSLGDAVAQALQVWRAQGGAS
jgi:hypothetical protein